MPSGLEANEASRGSREKTRTRERRLRELYRLAHADIRLFYDEHGQLKPIADLPDDLAACIASLEVVKKT